MSARRSLSLLPLILNEISKPASTVGADVIRSSSLCSSVFQSLQHSCRTFASHAVGGAKEHEKDVEFKQKIRQLVPLVRLQQDLQHEAELRASIPYEKLLEMIVTRGAARNKEEAQEVSAALQVAGLTVRHNEEVLLRPTQLVDTFAPDFPDTAELEQKVTEINAQLAPLERIHQEADRATMGLLYFGCFVLAAQLAGMWWLTYVEFSWDVMEPVAYLLSVFYALIGYMYFLGTRGHVFDLQPFRESAVAYFKGKKLEKVPDAVLDEERYQHLVKLRTQYLKRLQALKALQSKLTLA